jgi:hypothetical protein
MKTGKMWAVAEAKAKLSEVMRLARQEGPQRVGAQSPCYVLSEEDYLAMAQRERPLGAWLVEEFAGAGELPLPARGEPGRAVPFAEEEPS